jgi:two-component system chemotaxis response regulator CheV
MLGMVNIRGQIISVIDLPAVVGCVPKTGLNILLVTEYAQHPGLCGGVGGRDRAPRMEPGPLGRNQQRWCLRHQHRAPGFDKDTSRLAQVLDVEQILHEIMPSDRNMKMENLEKSAAGIRPARWPSPPTIQGGRSLIEQGLRAMEIPFEMHVTGKDAWDKMQKLAKEARRGKPIADKISFVLTDLEMPEMDGFTLTRNIKREDFLKNIPSSSTPHCPVRPTRITSRAWAGMPTSPSSKPTNWPRPSSACSTRPRPRPDLPAQQSP